MLDTLSSKCRLSTVSRGNKSYNMNSPSLVPRTQDPLPKRKEGLMNIVQPQTMGNYKTWALDWTGL